MFQTKDFASIAASMINWMKSTTQKVTDFSIGSIVRTMLEAIAAEIDELYQQFFIGIKEAIPVATYNSFSFDALPAQPATGPVRVTITPNSSADTIISAGTVFSLTGGSVTYTAEADATIAAGASYVDVQVAANAAGVAGNIPAGMNFAVNPQPDGLISATNIVPFENGMDTETEDARKVRFNDYIAALARGTPTALAYGLKTTKLTDASGNTIERVVSVYVDEPYERDHTQPVGLVHCYIHNGVGGTSSDLIAQAQKVVYGYYDANGNPIPGWKAAGTHVDVFAATELLLSIAGTLSIADGYDRPTLVSDANLAASTYIGELGIGETFQVASLVEAVMSIPGVTNFIPADIAAPAAPTLGAVAGGALAATTYYVATTYVTPDGETIASAVASLAVPANKVLTVASPPSVPGVTGWNVYIGTSAGALSKQNAAQMGLASSYTEPVSGLIAGAAVPAFSTARLLDISANFSAKFMPGTMGIA